jgi:peroxiredoxin
MLALSPCATRAQAVRTAPPDAAPAAKPAPVASAASAALGKPAPDFSLRDTDGNEVSLRALRGKLVVLEWFNPDCPFSKHAHSRGPLKDLAKRVASDKLVWLSINSAAPGKQGHGLERNRAAKGEYGIENALLLDETGTVGRAYGAEKTPHIFIIDAKGTLVYRGGLDNAPMGVVDDARPRPAGSTPGTLERYVEKALDALERGKKPPLRDTPPYGCSVKYGS